MFEGFTRFSSFGNRRCSRAGPKIRKGFKIQLTGRSEVWLNPNTLNFASLDLWIFRVFRYLCTNIIVKIAGRVTLLQSASVNKEETARSDGSSFYVCLQMFSFTSKISPRTSASTVKTVTGYIRPTSCQKKSFQSSNTQTCVWIPRLRT